MNSQEAGVWLIGLVLFFWLGLPVIVAGIVAAIAAWRGNAQEAGPK